MRALDPETETFSTPPTTPGLATEALRPSISRRNSRPTSLHIDQSTTEWNSDIVLEENSPGHLRKALSPHNLIHDQTATPRKAVTPFPNPINQRQISDHHPKSMESPCFVHSHLDKGASLTDWLRVKQNGIVDGIDVSVAKSLQHTDEGQQNPHYSPSDQAFTPPGSGASSVLESNDEDEFGGSLTKQLAETAVGVREMSKQLGQCSRLPPKARDLPLIFTSS
jgi:NAD+ kinase